MPHELVVAVVDDEPGMRVLLRRLFESKGLAVRCYDSAESLLRDQEDIHFGCIVVDIALTGISGLELLSQLRQRGTEMPIVMISGRATVSDAVAAFRERVSAFFEKPFNNIELAAVVKTLVTEWSEIQSKRQIVSSLLAELSPREKEVLDALVTGKKTTQIARELAISPSTVEKHRLHIFEKTGVSSVIGLLHLILNDDGLQSGRHSMAVRTSRTDDYRMSLCREGWQALRLDAAKLGVPTRGAHSFRKAFDNIQADGNG